ncbi:hypothetical protein BDZ89DRAFT_1138598 [Hymenopellis radicata]|nr:hypothetical protein BDZ89DRAFT_1138598 [Hymenopellis radicata]
MYANRIIDAVLTENSDTFVFGAPRVIRIRKIFDHAINVTVFEDIDLIRKQFIFIAILAGGDYSIRWDISFGDKLIQVALDLSSTKFHEFCPLWCQNFRKALFDASFIKARSLTRKIPEDFPNYNILQLYLCLRFSQGVTPPPVLCWDVSPNLGQLAAFAAKNLVWESNSTQLFQHFKQTIFSELAIRELVKSISSGDGDFAVDICPYSVIIDRVPPHLNQVAS